MPASIETPEIRPFKAVSMVPSLVSLWSVLSFAGGGSILMVISDKDGLELRQEQIF